LIYIFFAPGFEEIEAIATLDILRRAELEVQSVGVGAKR
jgi:4-methyl-5(b-hydroxyethyl)-thiazole monophosphate biosynthesis